MIISNVIRMHNLLNFNMKQYLSMTNNPYKILGVYPKSSAQDIKLAYYKLAQYYHPDKNSAKDASKKFSEINQAYEILSDEKQRRLYDSCSSPNENNNNDYKNDYEQEFNQSTQKKKKKSRAKQTSQANSYDDYETFFTEFDAFFQKKQGKKRPYYQKKKGEDIKLNIEIDFKESIFGTSKIMKIEKNSLCQTCRGTRSEPNTDPQTCYSCGGSGVFNYSAIGEKLEVQCEECDGWGKIIKCPCTKCQGKGHTRIYINEEIIIPQAVDDGQLLRKQFGGHSILPFSLHIQSLSNGENGDLLVSVKVKEDEFYRKDGHNIVSDLQLSISEVVLGSTKLIKTIWGDINLIIPPSQKPLTRMNIPQMGVQYGSSKWKKGDHIVILKLQVPKQIDQQTRDLFYEISKHNA